MTRRVLAVLLVLVAALAAAQPATAGQSRKKAIWGPVDAQDKFMMPFYKDLGVGIFQIQLRWERVAPTKPANPRDPSDPAYQWPEDLDIVIDQARPAGIDVALLVQGTPGWANGGGPYFSAPTRLKDYVDFLEAASRRYPEVSQWMIWGEPSRATGYTPRLPQRMPESQKAKQRAQSYARLLDLSYARLKRVSAANKVVGGMSYNSSGTVPGYQRPARWVRNLKLPNGRPPRMDFYGHNPFSARKPDIRKDPEGKDLRDLSDSDLLYKEVNRRLKRRKKIRLWLSEYSIPTDQPAPVFADFYVSRAKQGSWLRAAYKLAKTKKIYTLGYYRLIDDTPPGINQLGLLDSNLQPKQPGYDAFKNAF